MKKPTIYRKRYIPFETIDISGDELLFRSDDLIITRWKAIRPRKDISKGVSFTFLKDGVKISRFYDEAGNFIYWYCDIIDVHYEKEGDILTLIDLLVDLKIMPDGRLILLDADELAEATEKGLITIEQNCMSLKRLNNLLQTVYDGNFPPDVCKMKKYCEI